MATIKAYTDISQSKKLAEILPLESADMHYVAIYASPSEGIVEYRDIPEIGYNKPYTPCWSLAVLLNILSKQDFIIKSSERNNEYQYNIDIPSRHCKIWFSSLLDAAFEMICWLKENNKL